MVSPISLRIGVLHPDRPDGALSVSNCGQGALGILLFLMARPARSAPLSLKAVVLAEEQRRYSGRDCLSLVCISKMIGISR